MDKAAQNEPAFAEGRCWQVMQRKHFLMKDTLCIIASAGVRSGL
jgi:hypothetical protein